MNVSALLHNSQIPPPKPLPNLPTLKLPTSQLHFPKPTPSSKPPTLNLTSKFTPKISKNPTTHVNELLESPSLTIPRWVFLGGASLGLAVLILGFDGQNEALAFVPEGPLVEEFWDNMRRYGLYILTVSTGVVYTILQPIVELLKNPITAILIITVVVGSGYLVSQVLSAMVGISDFSYNYGY